MSSRLAECGDPRSNNPKYVQEPPERIIHVDASELQVDIPDGMLVNLRTLFALYALQQSGSVFVQIDDGPDGLVTMNQLKEIAKECDYIFVQSREHSFYLLDPDQVPEV